jgi:ribosomal protein S26
MVVVDYCQSQVPAFASIVLCERPRQAGERREKREQANGERVEGGEHCISCVRALHCALELPKSKAIKRKVNMNTMTIYYYNHISMKACE